MGFSINAAWTISLLGFIVGHHATTATWGDAGMSKRGIQHGKAGEEQHTRFGRASFPRMGRSAGNVKPSEQPPDHEPETGAPKLPTMRRMFIKPDNFLFGSTPSARRRRQSDKGIFVSHEERTLSQRTLESSYNPPKPPYSPPEPKSSYNPPKPPYNPPKPPYNPPKPSYNPPKKPSYSPPKPKSYYRHPYSYKARQRRLSDKDTFVRQEEKTPSHEEYKPEWPEKMVDKFDWSQRGYPRAIRRTDDTDEARLNGHQFLGRKNTLVVPLGK